MAPLVADASLEAPSNKRPSMMAGSTSTRGRSGSVDLKLMRSASIVDDATKDAAKSRRQAKLAGYFGITMALFLAVSALANFAIIFWVVDSQVQTQTANGAGNGTLHAMVDKNDPDSIIRVAEAEEDMPLVVAPVLPTDVLDRVKTLSATFSANYELFIRAAEPDLAGTTMLAGSRIPAEYLIGDAPPAGHAPVPSDAPAAGGDPLGQNKTRMTVKYSITGYAVESDTSMTFFSDRGDKIIIEDGAAWIERPRGHVYYVSFSSAHAAAFKVSGVNATEMEHRAFDALEAKGITPGSQTLLTLADESARRQLSDSHPFMKNRRKMVVDYGWCSMSAGFVAFGGSDTSNYCDPSQSCDSSGGCGGSLSSCCITHDKCLQHSTRTDLSYYTSSSAGRCNKVNCDGATCDSALSSCAWGVSCSYKYKCGWWKCWGYDTGCGVASTAVSASMATQPNAGRFSGNSGCSG